MKELGKEIQKLLEDEKLYDVCRELGYTGTKEELLYEIKNSLENSDFSELTSEELELVAGGAQKGFGIPQRVVAALLVSTFMTGDVLPTVSANAQIDSVSQTNAIPEKNRTALEKALEKVWGSRKAKIITSTALGGILAAILAGGSGAVGLGVLAHNHFKKDKNDKETPESKDIKDFSTLAMFLPKRIAKHLNKKDAKDESSLNEVSLNADMKSKDVGAIDQKKYKALYDSNKNLIGWIRNDSDPSNGEQAVYDTQGHRVGVITRSQNSGEGDNSGNTAHGEDGQPLGTFTRDPNPESNNDDKGDTNNTPTDVVPKEEAPKHTTTTPTPEPSGASTGRIYLYDLNNNVVGWTVESADFEDSKEYIVYNADNQAIGIFTQDSNNKDDKESVVIHSKDGKITGTFKKNIVTTENLSGDDYFEKTIEVKQVMVGNDDEGKPVYVYKKVKKGPVLSTKPPIRSSVWSSLVGSSSPHVDTSGLPNPFKDVSKYSYNNDFEELAKNSNNVFQKLLDTYGVDELLKMIEISKETFDNITDLFTNGLGEGKKCADYKKCTDILLKNDKLLSSKNLLDCDRLDNIFEDYIKNDWYWGRNSVVYDCVFEGVQKLRALENYIYDNKKTSSKKPTNNKIDEILLKLSYKWAEVSLDSGLKIYDGRALDYFIDISKDLMVRRPFLIKELGISIDRNSTIAKNIGDLLMKSEWYARDSSIHCCDAKYDIVDKISSEFISRDPNKFVCRENIQEDIQEKNLYEKNIAKLAAQGNEVSRLMNFFRDFYTNDANKHTYGNCASLKKQLYVDSESTQERIKDLNSDIDFFQKKVDYLEKQNTFKEFYFKNSIRIITEIFKNTIEYKKTELEFINKQTKYSEDCIHDVEALEQLEGKLPPEEFNARLVYLKYQINSGFNDLCLAAGAINAAPASSTKDEINYFSDCCYTDGFNGAGENRYDDSKPNWFKLKLKPKQKWLKDRNEFEAYMVTIVDRRSTSDISEIYNDEKRSILTDIEEGNYNNLDLRKLEGALDNAEFINDKIFECLKTNYGYFKKLIYGSGFYGSRPCVIAGYYDPKTTDEYLEIILNAFRQCESEEKFQKAAKSIELETKKCKEISEKYYIQKSILNIVNSIREANNNFERVIASGKKEYEINANKAEGSISVYDKYLIPYVNSLKFSKFNPKTPEGNGWVVFSKAKDVIAKNPLKGKSWHYYNLEKNIGYFIEFISSIVDTNTYTRFLDKQGLQNNLWYSNVVTLPGGKTNTTLYINLDYLTYLCLSKDSGCNLSSDIKELFETYDKDAVKNVLKEMK